MEHKRRKDLNLPSSLESVPVLNVLARVSWIIYVLGLFEFTSLDVKVSWRAAVPRNSSIILQRLNIRISIFKVISCQGS